MCFKKPAECEIYVVRIPMILSFILFLIGVFTIANTCNPMLTNTCHKYYPIKATPYKYSLINQTCDICSDFQFNQCFARAVVPCYDYYVQLSYDNGQKTCFTQTVDNNINNTAAIMETRQQYKIGKEYQMLIQKSNSHGKCEQKPNNYKA